MLTVSDLMLSPIFSTATLAAGKSGLSNSVNYVGFLDWENIDEIPRYFNAGEMVVTTFLKTEDDNNKTESYLKALILNNSAAILIKDIWCKEISKELAEFAEKKHVPIFFFHDTYIDEILHEVKKQLEIDVEAANYEQILNEIFNDRGMNAGETEQRIKRLNPYFYKKAFMTLYISCDEAERTDKTEALYEYIHNNRSLLESMEIRKDLNTVYSRFIYKRGVLVIISFDCNTENKTDEYGKTLLKRFAHDTVLKKSRIGISRCGSEKEFSKTLRGCIFANVSCILNDNEVVYYNETDDDYNIYAVLNDKHLQEYCGRIEAALEGSDKRHVPLLETALTFVRCGGNIESTANSLYQHKNTIRYRLDRIAKVFNAENNLELYGKLYFWVKVYLATPYLKMFFADERAISFSGSSSDSQSC